MSTNPNVGLSAFTGVVEATLKLIVIQDCRAEAPKGRIRAWRAEARRGEGGLRFTVLGLKTAALKPRINPRGHLTPESDLYGEQSVYFEAAQLPPLFTQFP